MLKGACSRGTILSYFGQENYFYTEGKLENSSLLRQKNTKDIISHKETRTVKDGKD